VPIFIHNFQWNAMKVHMWLKVSFNKITLFSSYFIKIINFKSWNLSNFTFSHLFKDQSRTFVDVIFELIILSLLKIFTKMFINNLMRVLPLVSQAKMTLDTKLICISRFKNKHRWAGHA
jgi:hypothetical protein